MIAATELGLPLGSVYPAIKALRDRRVIDDVETDGRNEYAMRKMHVERLLTEAADLKQAKESMKGRIRK